jgi:small-conductance mechanosensitive channel
MMGRKVQAYRAKLAESEENTLLVDRCTLFLTYLCLVAGTLGPIAAGFGYFNIGKMLIVSTILALAVFATLYIFYALIAAFVEDSAPVTLEDGTQVQSSQAGLLRVFLAFASACLSLPLLALIWGARVSDLQDVWLMLSEGVKLGETRLSFSDLLTFALVFSIGYTITRMLQSGLRTAVLPKTSIDGGAQNALVTGLGYIGIFLAAAAAITSTGIDLSSLAIVAGALSVGIGFGLQNIVSNFVSGIILLIERPIRLGDWIDVGGTSGIVSKISVRSTIVETFDHSEVIVPNADFISGTVTNRTRNNKRGRVKVPVGVAYDSDPEQVKAILLSIVEDNTAVLKVPHPQVYLMSFGTDSIDFEIRGILRDVDNVVSAHSDMNFEILRRFKKAGIEIPFGQREIRIKNAEELSAAFNPEQTEK